MQASLETTGTSQQRAHGWLSDQALLTAATALLLLALCWPVFAAQRSPLNSDQSLYLAEALNIADGHGLTYPTHEPITHRAPLYPALLAGAFQLEGVSLDSAYLVPRLSIVANVLLLFFLGRALFGPWGGAVAGITAAASLYLRGLGTTLFLDSTQSAFLLAAFLVYWRAGSSAPRMACAGALLGASFLIKEASVLFLPLPLLFSLLYGFEAGWKRTFPAWFAGFSAVTAWWFIWVFIHTGDIFLIGPLNGGRGLLLEATLVPGLVIALALLKFSPGQLAANSATRACAGFLLVAWNLAFFLALEASGWRYDSDYIANLFHYLGSIFLPNVQPAPLIIVSWAWLVWTSKRSPEAGLLVLAALLYASFFLLAADRGLSLRDQLPLIYGSYLGLGGAAAWLVASGSSIDLGPRVKSLGGGGALAVVAALTVTVLISGTSLSQQRETSLQDDWDNPLVHQTSAWLARNIEPGATISSSRLYHSHLYFLTKGAHAVHQLPTVEVDLHTAADAAKPITRRSNLFRWGDFTVVPDSADDRWLYLTRYPQKGYFIALAENDLIDHLNQRRVDYVVITSQDAGFSSWSLNRYFDDNPAFELVHVITAAPQDEVRIYRVDRTKLAPQLKPAQITRSAYEYMVLRLSGDRQVADYLERVNPAGFRLTER